MKDHCVKVQVLNISTSVHLFNVLSVLAFCAWNFDICFTFSKAKGSSIILSLNFFYTNTQL